MTLPNAGEIMSQYLYGSLTPPSNFLSESMMRADSARSTINVDRTEFMTSGAGRFDNAYMLGIVKAFFTSKDADLSANGTEKRFSITELLSALGMPGPGKGTTEKVYQQYNFSDGNNDYVERSFIYNTSHFKLNDSAVFVVDEFGQRKIENFSLRHFNDNFDYESSNFIAGMTNRYSESQTDPSRIGRVVDINIRGEYATRTYSDSDYSSDVARYIREFNPIRPELLPGVNSLFESYWNNGITRFMDGDRPLFYGTSADDIQSGFRPSSFQREFMGNGVTYLAGDGDDKVFGTTYNDKLIGGAGNDGLNGREGNDELYGDGLEDASSGGNDELFGGEGADKLFGGAGNDKLSGGNGNDVLYGEFKSSELASGNDTLSGGNGNDILYGDSERYSSLDGDDILNGNAGDDILYGGGGSDILNGGTENDILYGDLLNPLEGGNDQLLGGDGDDQLFGGAGDDILSGAAGNDFLYGGFGDDELSGGGGADVFVFGDKDMPDGAGLFLGYDFVADFRYGQGDKLDFSAFGGLNIEETSWKQGGIKTDAGHTILFNQSDTGSGYFVRVRGANGENFGNMFLEGTTGPLNANWFIFA